MTDKHVLGPDIDLDVEVVRDKKDRRITEARAQRLAEEALAKAGVGRPSLTAPGARSSEVKARVPAELKPPAGARSETLRRDHIDADPRRARRYLRGA